MKLYYFPGACSLAPHIVAKEAGIPIDIEKVDPRKHALPDGSDYYAINPKGYVPALKLDDGSVLTENTAILQYLADSKPETRLAPPPKEMERYRLHEWLGFINSELHKPFGPLFGGGADATKAESREKIATRFKNAEAMLGDKPFTLGDTFTVADAYLFVILTWANYQKIDMSAYPKLMAFMARVAERPAVKAAMKAEGLIQ